jgi:hypothetical protein
MKKSLVFGLLGGMLSLMLSWTWAEARCHPGCTEAPGRERIKVIQARLAAVGSDPGPIDGILGPKTREALKQFQETEGLPSTGKVDNHTRDALERVKSR